MKRKNSASRRAAALLGMACILGVFTRAEAAAPAIPTIAVTPSVIGVVESGGCYSVAPCFAVKGATDPGAKVTVTASDTFGKSATASTWAFERNDSWAGVSAGDYILNMNITGLGTHDGTNSTITFVAYAENTAHEKSANSAPATATKKSGDPLDTSAPFVTMGRKGPVQGSDFGFMCGTGYCNFSPCFFGSVGGLTPQPIRNGWYSFSGPGCVGRWQISGSAEDGGPTSLGHYSEIKDVIVTVKDSSGATVQTISAIGTRRGTQGFFVADLLVADYQVFQSYTWSLVAIDALGNTSAPVTGSFTRAPL